MTVGDPPAIIVNKSGRIITFAEQMRGTDPDTLQRLRMVVGAAQKEIVSPFPQSLYETV